MNVIERIYRANEGRKSRFHTSTGVLCLNPIEFSYAAATTLNRLLFGSLVKRPWLAVKAIPLIEQHVKGARVFEYGSGMSTLWFSERAAEVISVESNSQWAQRIEQALGTSPTARLVHLEDLEQYATYIRRCDGLFDIILVDGMERKQCIEESVGKLRKGGLLILDNTDDYTDLVSSALSVGGFDVNHYSGYCPGILHPIETSVLIRR